MRSIEASKNVAKPCFIIPLIRETDLIPGLCYTTEYLKEIYRFIMKIIPVYCYVTFETPNMSYSGNSVFRNFSDATKCCFKITLQNKQCFLQSALVMIRN